MFNNFIDIMKNNDEELIVKNTYTWNIN